MLPMCHCNRLNELLLNIYASDSNFGERMAVHWGARNGRRCLVLFLAFAIIFIGQKDGHLPICAPAKFSWDSEFLLGWHISSAIPASRMAFDLNTWNCEPEHLGRDGLRWNVNGDLLLLWISIFGQTFAVEKTMRHRFEVAARNGVLLCCTLRKLKAYLGRPY